MSNKKMDDDSRVVIRDDKDNLRSLREKSFYLCMAMILSETNSDHCEDPQDIREVFGSIATDKILDQYLTLERAEFLLDCNLDRDDRGWVATRGDVKPVIQEMAREIHSGMLYDFSEGGLAEIALDDEGDIIYRIDVDKAAEALQNR